MLEHARLRVDAQAGEGVVHDEVDDAADGVGTVDRRSAAGQHVDPLDQLRRDEVDIGNGLRLSPAIRRRPLISTSVRLAPRLRRLTVAVPERRSRGSNPAQRTTAAAS